MPTELRYDISTGISKEAEYTPAPPPIPQSVTMAQARLALLEAGLLDQVGTTIAAMPAQDRKRAEIEWEYRDIVRRDSHLVLALGPALGLSDTDIDSLFIHADTL
jgi:hypothetical protein